MKNYPNQISSTRRLRLTLATADELGGRATSSNQEFGEACAFSGAYTFRNLRTASSAQIADRIAAEKMKKASNRGMETFAREARRTLVDLGWLEPQSLLVTVTGRNLLQSSEGSTEERRIVRESLLELEIASDAGAHHPVRTLLRLLEHQPSHRREGLELALEPRDDSESEFERILVLYALPHDERRERLSISRAQQDNAVKVFPALAEECGLIKRDGESFTLSSSGRRATAHRRPLSTPARARGGRLRTVTSQTIAQYTGRELRRILSVEEQLEAAAVLNERTARHQSLVRTAARAVEAEGMILLEDSGSADLVALTDDKERVLLFEMKTLEKDQLVQARRAVGQLSYYDFFVVKPQFPSAKVSRIACFDSQLRDETKAYLLAEQVSVLESTQPHGWQISLATPDAPASLQTIFVAQYSHNQD